MDEDCPTLYAPHNYNIGLNLIRCKEARMAQHYPCPTQEPYRAHVIGVLFSSAVESILSCLNPECLAFQVVRVLVTHSAP